jgi:hypothetical protein
MLEIHENFIYKIRDFHPSRHSDIDSICGVVHYCTLYTTGVHAEILSNSLNQKKGPSLNDEVLLNQLEEVAERIGITVRYENMNLEDSPGSGGLCRLKGEYVLIIHSRATHREKIRIVTRALRQFDLNGVYLRPVLRELLDKSDES